MPLVKITRSRQVTIPKELFEQLALRQGDYVEINREGDRLVLQPKVVVDRARAQAKAQVAEILERVWERNRSLDPHKVEAVIAQEVQALRKARRHKLGRRKATQ